MSEHQKNVRQLYLNIALPIVTALYSDLPKGDSLWCGWDAQNVKEQESPA